MRLGGKGCYVFDLVNLGPIFGGAFQVVAGPEWLQMFLSTVVCLLAFLCRCLT